MFSQDLFSQSSLNGDRTVSDKEQKIAEEKEELRKEISQLKSLRIEINKSLEYYEKVQPIVDKTCIGDDQNPYRNSQKVQDIFEIWKEELCRYSGIVCTKCVKDREYVFELYHSKKVSKKKYFVQILETGGKIKLGVWKMPILLDINEILSEHPLEDVRHVKNFVLLCKHYIDCQEDRETQFEALKIYIDELNKCSVQANQEIYTCIQLQIFNLQEIESGIFFDIILYIFYQLNEVKPAKLITDSFHGEHLSENLSRKLEKFFDVFKLLELKPAFERVFSVQDDEFFQWEKTFKNEDLVIGHDEEKDDSLSQGEADESSRMRRLDEREKTGENSQENDENERRSLNESSTKRKKTNRRVKRNGGNNQEVEKNESQGLKRSSAEGEKPNKNQKTKNIQIEGTIIFHKPYLHNQISGINEVTDTVKLKSTIKNKRRLKSTKISEESEKQSKINFSRKNNIRKNKELEEQEENEEMKIAKTKATNQPGRKKNKNTSHIGSKEKIEIQKKKTPKTFDLSNFVVKKKAKNFLKTNNSNSLKISPARSSKSSTPIPGRKQPDLPIETEISEIVRVNNPIYKSPEKRQRNGDSSDAELEETVDDPDQNLLRNLQEINEKACSCWKIKQKEKTKFEGDQKKK